MIEQKDFQKAAQKIGCEVAAIKAVYQVETSGRGYLPDGRVKILFEGHRFWKSLTKAAKDPMAFVQANQQYSTILYKNWNKAFYIGGVGEWNRMSKAIEVCKMIGADPELALDSASYGSFQIMGENSVICGYATAQEMLADFNTRGEIAQLDAFVNFVKSKKIDKHLVTKNWPAFAADFNGTAYRLNQYDVKLIRAYQFNVDHP